MSRRRGILLVLLYIAYRFLAPWWAFRLTGNPDEMAVPWGHRVG